MNAESPGGLGRGFFSSSSIIAGRRGKYANYFWRVSVEDKGVAGFLEGWRA
jgi:hypothetical protein